MLLLLLVFLFGGLCGVQCNKVVIETGSKKYVVNTEKMNWIKAELWCRRLNSDRRIRILTKKENEDLFREIKKNSSTYKFL